MKKNLALVSVLFAAALAACGGGDSSSSAPAPVGGTDGAATPTSATGTALDLAKAFLTAYDSSLATTIPASGVTALAMRDGCSLHNGYSKALAVTEYDADPLRVARRQFDIGSTRTNVAVLDERTITNAGITTRREIDVEYVVNYKDGTKNEKATETLITGSSSGSKLADGSACATPENKAELRFYGNRNIANTFVSASNERSERTALATGLAVTPQVRYSKYVTLGVQDPAKVVTYATVSGRGLTVSGTTDLVTLKLVSPRLLRDAPEFASKNGNFVDWKDTDNFRVCRTTTAIFAKAESADCVANGATGNSWGNFDSTDPIALDLAFRAWGFVPNGEYTFKLYADDGWKTVNGQAGKEPIATYTSALRNLPMDAIDLAGISAPPGSAPSNKFPLLLTASKTPAEIATALRAKAAISVDLTWSKPGVMPDARATALNQLWSFEQGRASTGVAFNPASRQFNPTFPGSTATSATLSIPAAVPALITPTYVEATLEYTNRNGNFIRSLYTWF